MTPPDQLTPSLTMTPRGSLNDILPTEGHLRGSHLLVKGHEEYSSGTHGLREPGQECLGVTREQMTFSDCLWDLQGKARARSNGGGKSNQRSDQRSNQRSRDAPTAFPGLGHPCPTFTFMSTVLHHLRITDPGQLGKSVSLSFPLSNCSSEKPSGNHSCTVLLKLKPRPAASQL